MKFLSFNRFSLQHEALEMKHRSGFTSLDCLSSLPFEPKPWQIETALSVLNEKNGDAILADEVGLGKTIEAGLIIKELVTQKLIKTVLVLVPSPLLEQWRDEMSEKFGLDFFDYSETGWEKSNFVISSLPYAARSKSRREELSNYAFDLVIIDEAHSLKNHRTSTYKFVYGLKRKHTVLMTATPIQNDLRELFNLINLMKPGFFQSRKEFVEHYIADRFRPKNTERLKELLQRVMIRHRRSNTLVELPRRHVHTLPIELEDNERSVYDDVIAYCQILYRSEMFGTKEEVARVVLFFISLLKQNGSSPQATLRFLERNVLPKVNGRERSTCVELCERLREIPVPKKASLLLGHLKEHKEQAIVYSEFIETLNMLSSMLTNAGISHVVFHGGLSKKEKSAALEQFKSGKATIFLSSESGGQGINLQHCHILYNYDLPWNPMRIEQRIGRVHRFGQTKEVHIYTMPTKGTLDEYILYILTSKVNLFQTVIGELDTIMSYLLDDGTSLETKIGRMILESPSPRHLENSLRSIGDELITAKKEYLKSTFDSNSLLEEIGVDVREQSE